MIGNDEVAEIVARYPDRFIAVAAVDLHRPMGPVRDCLADLETLALDKRTTEAFLHRNAERVFAIRQTEARGGVSARPHPDEVP